MGCLFLLLANLAGITKVAVMKGVGKACPGEYNSVRVNGLRGLICVAVSVLNVCAIQRKVMAIWRHKD